MKNYARKTNRSLTRYRTPATFRLRAIKVNQNSRLDNNFPGKNDPSRHWGSQQPTAKD